MRKASDTGTPEAPATIDGRTLHVLPTPSRRKAQLTSLEGVRTEMARVYRDMESGKRDSQDGSRLVYVLTQIAKVLELTEIERRLILLEGKANAYQLPAPNRGA
jgi:hypothetical protein